jgi:chromosome segregation ATPase
MITHISEKETQLVSMLRKTGQALDACTAERDRLRDQLHTCGPDCTKAGCVNRRLRDEIAGWKADQKENLRNQCELVQERDALKDTLQDVRGHYERVCQQRDTYQREADKLAWENKTLRDALKELLEEAESGIATCPLTRNKSRAALGVSL